MKKDRDLEDPEILRKIQEVEARIEQMSVQALSEAQQLVARAREGAGRLLEERRQQVKAMAVQYLQEGISVAEQEGRQIKEQAAKQAQELKNKALLKLEAAVDLVLRRVFPDRSEGE